MLTLGYILGGLVAAGLIVSGVLWTGMFYLGSMMSDVPNERLDPATWWGLVLIALGIGVIVLMVRG